MTRPPARRTWQLSGAGTTLRHAPILVPNPADTKKRPYCASGPMQVSHHGRVPTSTRCAIVGVGTGARRPDCTATAIRRSRPLRVQIGGSERVPTGPSVTLRDDFSGPFQVSRGADSQRCARWAWLDRKLQLVTPQNLINIF